MKEIKEYLKQLTDEGIIHQNVKNDIIWIIKKHILKKKL